MNFKKLVLALCFGLTVSIAYGHHGDCIPFSENADFSICGSHTTMGRSASFTLPEPEVTTKSSTGVLCVNDPEAQLKNLKFRWVEYMHDDYEGEIPEQDVLMENISFINLGQGCAQVAGMSYFKMGAWLVEIELIDGDRAFLSLEIER